jgi:hypothetical protein
MTKSDEPMVDNPQRQALETLKANLQRETHELTKLLQGAETDTGPQGTWVGPTAASWHTEIAGRRKDLGIQLAKLVPEVQAAIDRCPQQVTQSQAKSMRADL